MVTPNRLHKYLVLFAAAVALMAIPSAKAVEPTAVQTASYGCTADCGCPSCGCDADCGCGDGCCDCCGDGCRDVCVASVEKVSVEKHCWKVECEKICVPKVVCPWAPGGSGLTCFNWLKKNRGCASCGDACCGDACGCCDDGCGGTCPQPRCGKVKCVRTLKKETYECDKCVCRWEIRRLPPCCGDECGCCDSVGCGSACGASTTTTDAEVQVASATEELAEESTKLLQPLE